MTLSEARQAAAAALSRVDGWRVQARPSTAAPRAGDGWVTIGRLAPSTYTATSAVMTALLVLGSDATAAEQRLESDSVALIGALTSAVDLCPADVSLEPQALITGTTPGQLYVAALTFTLEVD